MTINRTKFSQVYNSYNAGFIMYFKLILLNDQNIIKYYKSIWKDLSFVDKNKVILQMLYKFPWWLLIKPIGCIFSTKYFYKGYFDIYPSQKILKYKVKKNITFKIMKIPVFFWRTKKLNNIDIYRIAEIEQDDNYTIINKG